MNDLRCILGENIKRNRISMQISQNKFAEQIEISPSHLREIEHGRTNPGVDMIARIAAGLNLPPEELLSNGLSSNSRALANHLISQLRFIAKRPPARQTMIIRQFEQLLLMMQDATNEL